MELDRRVLAELRTLPEGLAEQVAKLLVATSMALAEDDPKLALEFATEAKRKAGRVAVVREALGLAAYAAGDYALALAELRAVKRITGDPSHVPLMADCERGLGRPRKALDLLAEMPADGVEDAARIEALIVEAGARRDLGQPDMAVVILRVPALNARRTEPWLARLRYAYADALESVGRTDDAHKWFTRAAEVDTDGLTDAEERLAEMDGVVFSESHSNEEESVSE
jgi:tetratricopeptide (TPR) repeat protein